jgi:hypothetical protein
MGTPINPNNYPDLFTYCILSQTGITFGGGSGTVVNYGNYGSAGAITGTVVPGVNVTNNPVLVPTATAELGNQASLPGTLFYDVINNGFPTNTLTSNSYGAVELTFNRNKSYSPPVIGNALTFNGTTLKFDAQSDSNSQFFIITDANISFNTVTFQLINGALPQNIFWLAGTAISHTNPSNKIQGIFIADTAITFASTTSVITIAGNLYANTAISFTSNKYIVNGKTIPLPIPIPFNASNYPTLFSFSIVSGNDIAFNNTAVNGGNYGASGTITGLSTGSGLNDPNNDLNTALLELGNLSSGAGTLVFDLVNNGYGFETLQQNYTDTSKTFKPFINYVADSYTGGVPDGLDFNQTGSNVVTLTFDAENDPNAQFFILSSGYIHFTNSIDMVLINGAQASNIFWLAEGGNITADENNTKYGNFISSNGIDFSSSNNMTINGNLFHFGTNDTINFNASGDSVNGQGGPVVCYLKGTKILTQRGHIAIENNITYDRVITKGKIINNETLANDNFKLEPIVWLSKFKVRQPSSESFPICIKQNALGPNRPFEDLYVSPNHGIIVKGKIVRAKDLVNDESIFQDWSNDSLIYYHLELKSHSAIVANGILSESYLDIENRYKFESSKSVEPIRKSENIIVKNKNINPAKLVNFINQTIKSIKSNKKIKKQSNMIKTF